ncbi:unnamed protein product [Aphanomyces euteiches]|nr:hypothetical protein Ae201684P_015210 [Aphanomyces euteiches]KAH9156422.1 hypothetical protein AeRB84_001655 [Aphanomyces euteiches]
MVAQCIEPLLISGHKFDIGLHVLIASIDPLRVFIYQNAGLRFCKLQYPTSLNDSSPLESYVVEDYLPPWEIPDLKHYYHEIPSFDVEGTNHFAVLRQYLAHINIDPDQFQNDIYGAVVKLIAGNRDHFKRMQSHFHQEYQQPGANNFFEMCRFDFMVDDKGNDSKAKENIVNDLLQMIGIQSPAEAMRRNKIFQVNNNYCDPKCHDMERIYDMTCWSCPGWLASAEANVLYQSAVEYLRRGRYKLIFPTADDAHVPFLDGGRTSYDIAFSRYIQSLAKEKLDLNASVICSKSDHCSTHGVCVNGQCICDSGFEGVVCAEVVLPLDIGISQVKNPNSSIDKLKNFHSPYLRVVGAATTPHGTSTLSIVHLAIAMTIVFGTIYVIAKFVKCKRRTAKEQ